MNSVSLKSQCFPRRTLSFSGNKIYCSPRDQSLSDLLYCIAKEMETKPKPNFEKRAEIPAKTSGTAPDNDAHGTSQQQTQVYSEIHHNDNPFVLRLLLKEAKICKGCNNHFCHRQRIVPYDLVLEHKERYFFPIDGDWKKKQASNKEASRYYHADPGCVQPRFPYFTKDYIEIPQEIENLLCESHKSHLRKLFSLSL